MRPLAARQAQAVPDDELPLNSQHTAQYPRNPWRTPRRLKNWPSRSCYSACRDTAGLLLEVMAFAKPLAPQLDPGNRPKDQLQLQLPAIPKGSYPTRNSWNFPQLKKVGKTWKTWSLLRLGYAIHYRWVHEMKNTFAMLALKAGAKKKHTSLQQRSDFDAKVDDLSRWLAPNSNIHSCQCFFFLEM